VGLRFERIPEEDEEIVLAVDYLGADLPIAIQGSALTFVKFDAKLPFQYLAGGSCRI
jgi:hypothetical protein